MNTTQLNISRTLIDLKVVREFQRSVVEVIAEESVLAPLTVDSWNVSPCKTDTYDIIGAGHKRHSWCNLLHRHVLTSHHQQSTEQAPTVEGMT